MYQWDFTSVIENSGLLWQGLLGTLAITGTALALSRLSPRKVLAWPAGFIIEFFRTTPPLVQLFWFFFALPILMDIQMTPYLAAAITFSIQSSAFFAEVFRADLVSIERGQWEAGRAIGMRYREIMTRIILPQAVRRMMPALTIRGLRKSFWEQSRVAWH
ncbi:amino acid ABC transporter permease [Octadecabacter sp. G9-8]|uniref:Amino acid ABC transporter permease n=1 Tax=Octadecabacter dasysiphoniae TaxID=2909341 RepID=A0ABS9D122_9RHOB|nr:amino acid ABC transporter permease [Octadecabacter dasysiphoniae]MCF2873017.1 amino acid ABC transporter permease [Octadecabacter dasysiphoniae]